MHRPPYVTREQVKEAGVVTLTARHDDLVDQAIVAGSDAADGMLRRRFYPVVGTFTHAPPSGASRRVLFLDGPGAELAAAPLEVRVGGVAVDPGAFRLPGQPPYRRIEFETAVSGTVEIDGVAGYDMVEQPATVLAAAVNDSSTTVKITNSGHIGVGSLLRIGAERMLVTGRAMTDTGATLTTPLPASVGATTVEITGGTVEPGEVLLADAERLRVVDVAGDRLVVRRAWDGSVLAAHETGAELHGLRTLTVQRGVLGTTAGEHEPGAAVHRHVYPGVVVALVMAIAQVELVQWASRQGQEVQGGVETVLELAAERAKQAVGVTLLMV